MSTRRALEYAAEELAAAKSEAAHFDGMGQLLPSEPIDHVLHDWMNMPERERDQALTDVRALAETHAGAPRGWHR